MVAPPAPIAILVRDLTALTPEARPDEAQRLAAAYAAAPFDLARGPLLRVTLIRLSADDHLLVLTLHHLITDGWSTGILLRELAAGYTAHLQHRPHLDAPLPLQYAEFAAWQRDWLATPARDTLLTYWRDVMAGAPPVLTLPTDRMRPESQRFRGALHPFVVPSALTHAVHRLAREEGITAFMLLLAAFQLLVARISGQNDIVVGSPLAQRSHTALEGLIGCFVNTLPLRLQFADDPTVRTLFARVKESCLGAYAHRELPFEGARRRIAARPLLESRAAVSSDHRHAGHR